MRCVVMDVGIKSGSVEMCRYGVCVGCVSGCVWVVGGGDGRCGGGWVCVCGEMYTEVMWYMSAGGRGVCV